MNTFKVYCYTSPSGKRYIGQTCQSLIARSGSNGQQYKASTKFFNAIQKYGFDNFTVKILKDNLSQQEADYWEKYYIAYYDSIVNGYNIQSGGHFNPADICSKAIMSINCQTKEIAYYESITEAAKIHDLNRRSINKVVNHEPNHYTIGGYVWIALKEWNELSLDERNKYLNIVPKVKNKKQAVICKTTGKVYPSIKDAFNETGINNISACCRGKIKSAGKYNGKPCVWEYVENGDVVCL